MWAATAWWDCTGTLANSGTLGTPTITGLGLASGKVASLKVVSGAAGHLNLSGDHTARGGR